ncbi:kirola-like [Andrographis paniculata]|uniref:kirola-like n=1 Tax=Andrographis paniculata TaxID=175694 RepID=UPI0021E95DE7|nr:kirola-like [Andrographis paniculata]
MGLMGRLVAAIEFKAGGDVFHELFRDKPQHIAAASPARVYGCDLHAGEFGKVGTNICWKYFHDGKDRIAKQVIQKIDEEKKLMEFKMLEGDLMEKYKNFLITIHVETKGNIELVTWTLEYELLNEDVEHPISLLAFFIELTKDIESHHLKP